jgi:formylglycine-generating enzyme required for sulfatase activity
MADVFFSYKREDRAAVARLVRLLEAEGIAVWWDPSIVPGERYAEVIHRALDEASCVVVGWSHHSVGSIWVQDEAGVGRDRGVLVPVSLDGVDPPLGFRQLQTVSLADWNGRPDDPRIRHFIAGVRRLVGKPAEAEPAPWTASIANLPEVPGLGKAESKGVLGVTARASTVSKASAFWSPRNVVLFAVSFAAVLLAAGVLLLLLDRYHPSSVQPLIPRHFSKPQLRAFTDCGSCPVMIVVPTGSFIMGSPDREPQRGSDEGPQREVTISQALAVGKYPVTIDDWEFCVSQRGCTDWPSVAKFGHGFLPAINVSWEDAKGYVAWLSRITGKTYRLMSEAEREYVARAGTTTPFWWGSSISTSVANYDATQRYIDEPMGEFRQHTMPADSFQANPWGFFDMSGNTWDWVEDCYHDNYDGAPTDGSAWTTGDCNRRVLRGGGWASQPRNLRSATRWRERPVVRGDWYGFRVARVCDAMCNR